MISSDRDVYVYVQIGLGTSTPTRWPADPRLAQRAAHQAADGARHRLRRSPTTVTHERHGVAIDWRGERAVRGQASP